MTLKIVSDPDNPTGWAVQVETVGAYEPSSVDGQEYHIKEVRARTE